MKQSRKQATRLEMRRKDFDNMMATRNTAGGTQQRKDTGGFKRPGSGK